MVELSKKSVMAVKVTQLIEQKYMVSYIFPIFLKIFLYFLFLKKFPFIFRKNVIIL